MVLNEKMKAPQGVQAKVASFVEGGGFVKIITLLIFINAVTLGLETDNSIMDDYGTALHFIDKAILLVFTLELALKFYAYRLGFYKSGWNIFDFLIVSIAWVPAGGAFSILRALRVLRLFRLFSVVPQMRKVVGALLYSLPGMASVGAILLLIFYVCAVLATSLFGHHSNANMQEWFGSISGSFYTLFQVMTLESWSMGIVRPTMELFPYSWLFFVPFIIVTSFAVLNLFIGIIVDAMQVAQVEPRDADKSEINEFTRSEMEVLSQRFDALQQEIVALKQLMTDGFQKKV